MTQPDITSWKLESLRITVFLADQLPDNGRGTWKNLTGQDPETVTTRPQNGEHNEDGAFEDCRLSFNANMLNPYRIDWVMYPQAREVSGYPSIGGYVEETQRLFGIFEQWFKNECPPAIRLAYGATLLQEIPNKKLGYETLAGYLPHIKFNTDGWADFLFQVNDLSTSKAVNSLELNRISRWMVIKKQRFLVESSGPHSVSDSYACRLELDLSTATENKVAFSSENMIALFKELRGIADQYAEEGFPK